MGFPVFYSDKMVAESQSVSPSASKPAKVVASWKSKFPIELHEPTPVTVQEICQAHDPTYVNEVMSLTRNNGFGNRSASVAMSLPYTTGAMLSAARHAIKTKGAAAAPCSGFHHAGYEQFETFGYFCTFNGLMVTAMSLNNDGVKKVGILDFDMHYGNGTADIIDTLQVNWVTHFTAGALYQKPSQAQDFFHMLPNIMHFMKDCDVILYQAGADPHINDPYGGWLTTEQLRQRDLIVFDSLKTMGIPVAWNLAGGYQTEPDGSIPKVLEIHDNTMAACITVYGSENGIFS